MEHSTDLVDYIKRIDNILYEIRCSITKEDDAGLLSLTDELYNKCLHLKEKHLITILNDEDIKTAILNERNKLVEKLGTLSFIIMHSEEFIISEYEVIESIRLVEMYGKIKKDIINGLFTLNNYINLEYLNKKVFYINEHILRKSKVELEHLMSNSYIREDMLILQEKTSYNIDNFRAVIESIKSNRLKEIYTDFYTSIDKMFKSTQFAYSTQGMSNERRKRVFISINKMIMYYYYLLHYKTINMENINNFAKRLANRG